MRNIKVTYRTIEPGLDVNGQPSTRMIVKTASFMGTGSTGSRDTRVMDGRTVDVRTSDSGPQNAGYQIDGPFLRAYGGGKTLLVQKAEVLEVVADE